MKLKSNERNIFFTSDTHYGHKNIVQGVSDWRDKTGCRDFNTIEKMNSIIVDTINKYVQQDDILIHLGDWSMGGQDNVNKFNERLNVTEIHLILGNHDTGIKRRKHDFFASINKYLELFIDKQAIILSHYPMISWNGSYRESWMLHGHAHNTTFKNENSDHWYYKSKIFDVGLDTAFAIFGEYRPFNFNEIKNIMNKRNFISTDHHNKNTDK